VGCEKLKSWERGAHDANDTSGESRQAYEALSAYLDLGPKRSIRAVAQKLHKSSTLVGRWSRKWKWVERAKAYDAHLGQIKQRAIEEETGRESRKVVREIFDDLRENMQLGKKLKRKTGQILDLPHTDVEVDQGGHPVKVTAVTPPLLGHASRMAEAGVKITQESLRDLLRLYVADEQDTGDAGSEDAASSVAGPSSSEGSG